MIIVYQLTKMVLAIPHQWFEALTADPQNGNVIFPNRPAVRATLGGGWFDAPAGSQTGFNEINVNRGGFLLGNNLASGQGKFLIVPTTGMYLVIMTVYAELAADFRLKLKNSNSPSVQLFIETNISVTKSFNQVAISVINLTAGSELYYEFNRFARCYHAQAHTELSLTMI